MRAEAKFGEIFIAVGDDGVEGVVEARKIEGFNAGGVAVDVILKVLAQKTAAIPGMAAFARLQEEAGALDTAKGEDVVAGAEDGFNPRQGAGADSLCSFIFEEKLDGAGVEPNMDFGMGSEGFVVEASEVRFGAPAGEIGFEAFELGEGEPEVAPDSGITTLDLGEPSRVRARS